jgi:hypothetical protein
MSNRLAWALAVGLFSINCAFIFSADHIYSAVTANLDDCGLAAGG